MVKGELCVFDFKVHVTNAMMGVHDIGWWRNYVEESLEDCRLNVDDICLIKEASYAVYTDGAYDGDLFIHGMMRTRRSVKLYVVKACFALPGYILIQNGSKRSASILKNKGVEVNEDDTLSLFAPRADVCFDGDGFLPWMKMVLDFPTCVTVKVNPWNCEETYTNVLWLAVDVGSLHSANLAHQWIGHHVHTIKTACCATIKDECERLPHEQPIFFNFTGARPGTVFDLDLFNQIAHLSAHHPICCIGYGLPPCAQSFIWRVHRITDKHATITAQLGSEDIEDMHEEVNTSEDDDRMDCQQTPRPTIVRPFLENIATPETPMHLQPMRLFFDVHDGSPVSVYHSPTDSMDSPAFAPRSSPFIHDAPYDGGAAGASDGVNPTGDQTGTGSVYRSPLYVPTERPYSPSSPPSVHGQSPPPRFLPSTPDGTPPREAYEDTDASGLAISARQRLFQTLVSSASADEISSMFETISATHRRNEIKDLV
jgi:hypothetical protein